MISSFETKEESFIENNPISFKIQALSDDNSSLEIKFLSSPSLFYNIKPLKISNKSIQNFKSFNPFTDEDYLLELLSIKAIFRPCAPPPIPTAKYLVENSVFFGSRLFSSPIQSKPLITHPKFLTGDGSFIPPYTCLPLFKWNSYFSKGMYSFEGTLTILQSQIVFWVDPQKF